MIRPRQAIVLAMAMTALAACSSPTPNLYTLVATAGAALPTPRLAVELRRISLAGYLDRGEIVRGTVQYQLKVSDIDRWGEPLGRMLERVLTEDLVMRLPNAAVFTEAGAISTRPDRVLEVDVQRLDPQSGTVVLLAQIAVRHEGGVASADTVRLTAPLSDPGAASQVAAMSAVVGQLADTLAKLLAN